MHPSLCIHLPSFCQASLFKISESIKFRSHKIEINDQNLVLDKLTSSNRTIAMNSKNVKNFTHKTKFIRQPKNSRIRFYLVDFTLSELSSRQLDNSVFT